MARHPNYLGLAVTLAAILPCSVNASQTIPLEALTTSYWVRQHDIPDFYKTVSVSIVSSSTGPANRRLERLMDSLGARQIRVDQHALMDIFTDGLWPAPGQTVWELARPKEGRFESAVHKQPGCNYVRTNETESPRAELFFKRDRLLREATSHYEITASTVARSFLESELQTLNQLLWRDQHARDIVGLFVTIAPPGKSPPFVDAPVSHVEPARTIFAANDPALAPSRFAWKIKKRNLWLR